MSLSLILDSLRHQSQAIAKLEYLSQGFQPGFFSKVQLVQRFQHP
ncbi:hypothetical protein [Planktothrix agardhii]|nr:hypothetical protein [Planktothrix agardhii]